MDLTRDAFLGGRIALWQPHNGYRAGIDPVLLAAAVPAKAGQSVLDLGCGVGTALLCLAARVPGLDLSGVEKLPAYAALATRNAAENGIAASVWTAGIEALPQPLRHRQYDHVMANPPYFAPGTRTGAGEAGREAGRGEDLPLALWLDAGCRRLCPGGQLTLIQRADRLPDILAGLAPRLGALRVLPIAARAGRAARHVIVAGRKARRDPLRLCPPLVLHEGPRHTHDGDSYRPEIQAVLRDAAPLTAISG